MIPEQLRSLPVKDLIGHTLCPPADRELMRSVLKEWAEAACTPIEESKRRVS